MQVRDTFPIEWRCRACRFEQELRVSATGMASHSRRCSCSECEKYLDSHVRSDLTFFAHHDAWREAHAKLALRPCPECGAVDRLAFLGAEWPRLLKHGVKAAFYVGWLLAMGGMALEWGDALPWVPLWGAAVASLLTCAVVLVWRSSIARYGSLDIVVTASPPAQ